MFRSELVDGPSGAFVLATSLDRCLIAYPIETWKEFGGRLAGVAAEHDGVVRAARRWYLGGAFTLTTDSHGRCLLPAPLREWAGVARELVWVGVGDHLEAWDPQRLEESRREVLRDPAALAAALAGKGL
jgi:MraZ protein